MRRDGEVSHTKVYSTARLQRTRTWMRRTVAGCQANDIPLTDELTALKLLLPEH